MATNETQALRDILPGSLFEYSKMFYAPKGISVGVPGVKQKLNGQIKQQNKGQVLNATF